MAGRIQHCAKSMQFFVNLQNSAKAHLDYKLTKNVMDLHHTFVPPEGRGQGLAEEIVREAFGYAKANKYTIVPTCTYVQKYAKEIATPEEQSLVQGLKNKSAL